MAYKDFQNYKEVEEYAKKCAVRQKDSLCRNKTNVSKIL